MKTVDYLLIGGGLASAKAARQIREQDKRGRIAIAGEEPQLPYDRPPLSKEIIRGELRPQEIRISGRFSYLTKRIAVWTKRRVTGLELDANPGRRYPHVASFENGKKVRFRKALLATGGTPCRLRGTVGSELANVFALRSVNDATRIAAHATQGARAVVVGGGFIGVELAASLSQRGCQVTLVEQASRLWPGFAPEALSSHLQSYLEHNGIGVRCNDSVRAFHGTTALSSVEFASGSHEGADFACIACGIDPRLDLAQAAGLEVNDGLVVDEQLRSSHEDIYGAGDIIRFYDPHFDEYRRVEHYGQAEYTGLLAGKNMAGADSAYDLLSYVWSDVFDLHIEAAGLEHGFESIVVRGSLEDQKALLLLIREGRILGYVGVNAGEADFGPLQMLIKRRVDVSSHRETLADPNKPLAPLLQSS
jgi:NADPH-dependent 2,4-dienoyl-CoA reductase/sulfur reductase-like enzyme